MIKRFIPPALWFAVAVSARATVALNPLFTDHAVLQRDQPLPVWGTAAPGEEVSVTLGSETKTARAGADGKWMVTLAPQPVSTTPATLTAKGTNAVSVSDILVGDVWLGSGQSNMVFPLRLTDGAARIKALPADFFRNVRLFNVPCVGLDQPGDTVATKWTDASPAAQQGFSAVMMCFAEALTQADPSVPLGLICSARGATNAYSWINNETRDTDPSLQYLRDWWARVLKSYTPEKEQAFQKATEDYAAQAAQYKAQNKSVPNSVRPPGEMMGPKWDKRPSGLYNGMIAPLEPYAIRGMIWYQGEWDARPDWVKIYEATMEGLVNGWRKDWAAAAKSPQAGEWPAYIVQLPSGKGPIWPFLRDTETAFSAKLPKTEMVVTFDLNEGGAELHPKEKTGIGQRLARIALAQAYGKTISFRGPVLKQAQPEGDKVVLTFEPGATGLKSLDGEPLRNFEVAGSDGKYVPATATISGDTVTVSSPQVSQPLTVRYAFTDAPAKANFVNSDDLPAGPFRTDKTPAP